MCISTDIFIYIQEKKMYLLLPRWNVGLLVIFALYFLYCFALQISFDTLSDLFPNTISILPFVYPSVFSHIILCALASELFHRAVTSKKSLPAHLQPSKSHLFKAELQIPSRAFPL